MLLQSVLESKGIRLRTPFRPREAGCMYPLVACAIIVHEMDAMELGNLFFEDFGKAPSALQHNGNNNTSHRFNTSGESHNNMNKYSNDNNNEDDGNVAGNGGCASQ